MMQNTIQISLRQKMQFYVVATKKDIGKVPPACIFTTIIPALMIAELFFFDSSFALQLAEQKE
ncbi:hypothetical protein Tco_0755312, partial [Tanacetum coccineum]